MFKSTYQWGDWAQEYDGWHAGDVVWDLANLSFLVPFISLGETGRAPGPLPKVPFNLSSPDSWSLPSQLEGTTGYSVNRCSMGE